ncbi:MAG: aminotransferase class V-fold PLP-dependent enzyme [Candidatus Velthaea sp.]
MNHAAVGVLPIATRDAVHAFVDAHAARGVLGTYKVELDLPKYRGTIGALIGAAPDEIALLRNTGDGATVLARGLRLKPGDEVITGRNEFGANAYPWLALREEGVAVRFIDAPRERMTPGVLARELTPRTKAVAVSWVSFDDGYRHDLAALAEVAHRNGSLLFVDAIQGLGVFPLDVRAANVDAVYAGGAKWLMSVPGVSFLYVAAALQERVAPVLPGWRSVADIWDFLDYDQPWAPNATRYEGGTPNMLGALSMATSIAILQSAGIDAIAAHVLRITDRLADGLQRKGYTLKSVRSATESSGIVTFTKENGDILALGKHLAAQKIVTTNRATGIRISPHGHNTDEEMDHILALL